MAFVFAGGAWARLRADSGERAGAELSGEADPAARAPRGRQHRRHRVALRGQELARRSGQPVVVENKPGAGGTIAMAELARAAPDGYTIAFASQGTLVFNQAIYAKPGYDSAKDFAPIAFLGGVSNVMIVPPAERGDEARATSSRPRRRSRASSRSRRAARHEPSPVRRAVRALTGTSSCTCRTRVRRRACSP